ncbi:MAG: DUF1330 domain-containing protein [Litorimonas sp.]
MKRVAILLALALAACEPSVDTTTDLVEAPAIVADAPAPIGAYLIVQGKGYDPADIGPYAASLPPIYETYGGRYVAFDTTIDVAEGDSDYQVLIMSAWPSEAAARAFWDSPEYAEAIKLREGIGTFDVVIVGALPD